MRLKKRMSKSRRRSFRRTRKRGGTRTITVARGGIRM